MKVKVMYFARYREALGVDVERVEGISVLDDVRQALVAKGGQYAVLAEQNLMCARNEELCSSTSRWRRATKSRSSRR
jgi:molybdopterin synthase sulfur carrier subunit